MIFTKIFFDCDSTLIQAESLDLLAELRGVGKEARKLTERSMNGEVPLEEVFVRKMNLIAPSQADVEKIALECKKFFVPGVREVVENLQKAGAGVFIVSSNFHTLIDPLAKHLGIPLDRVVANDLYFDDCGQYRGINESSPLCTSNGKKELIAPLLEEGDYSVFVGDGSSDICTKEVVDLFVGFGGVCRRSAVEDAADVYLTRLDMRPLLKIVA